MERWTGHGTRTEEAKATGNLGADRDSKKKQGRSEKAAEESSLAGNAILARFIVFENRASLIGALRRWRHAGCGYSSLALALLQALPNSIPRIYPSQSLSPPKGKGKAVPVEAGPCVHNICPAPQPESLHWSLASFGTARLETRPGKEVLSHTCE